MHTNVKYNCHIYSCIWWCWASW